MEKEDTKDITADSSITKVKKNKGGKEPQKNFFSSIGAKMLYLVLGCIVLLTCVTILYVIPQSRKSVTSAVENNMLDQAISSSKIVDINVESSGMSNVTSSVLRNVLGDVNINGIESSYIYVVDASGDFIYHKRDDKIGTKVTNNVINELLKNMKTGNYEANKVFHYTDENGVVKYAAYQASKKTGWVTVLVADEKDILAPINKVVVSGTLISSVVGIIVLIIGWIVSRMITAPIKKLTYIIKKTANLDFSSEDNKLDALVKKKDETGEMCRAMTVMQKNLYDMVNALKNIAQGLDSNAVVLKEVTEEINHVSTDNSATTEELAASMQETSATMDTISNNTSYINDDAESIDRSASSGLELAKQIENRAAQMNITVVNSNNRTKSMYENVAAKTKEAIEQAKAVSRINEMASTIRDIADQTSLLSLNASIEAARAGEMGKGFAVVAGEIGALASQSTNTVESIMDIIEDVNVAVKNMNDCMTETLRFLEEDVMNDYATFTEVGEQYDTDSKAVNASMTEIYDIAQSLKSSTGQIISAISDINVTIGEAAVGVNDIAEKTTDVVTLSTNVVSVVGETTEQSEKLDAMADAFTL